MARWSYEEGLVDDLAFLCWEDHTSILNQIQYLFFVEEKLVYVSVDTIALVECGVTEEVRLVYWLCKACNGGCKLRNSFVDEVCPFFVGVDVM